MSAEIVFLGFGQTSKKGLARHMETLLGIKGITIKSFNKGTVKVGDHKLYDGPHILIKITQELYISLVNSGKLKSIYHGFNVPVYIQHGSKVVAPPEWGKQHLIST